MQEILLDDRSFQNEYDIHQCLKKELCFPDYYGNNLDSLYDCLTELNEEITFRLNISSDSTLLQKFLPVFYDIEEDSPNITLICNYFT